MSPTARREVAAARRASTSTPSRTFTSVTPRIHTPLRLSSMTCNEEVVDVEEEEEEEEEEVVAPPPPPPPKPDF